MPPIYQPEVAAEAIVFAAHARRREVWVGKSAIQAIVANKIIPGLLDRYLANIGYTSQMADQRVAPDRQDNLFDPVPGDHGAHGRFDDQAKGHSVALELVKNRGWVMGGIAAAAVFAGALLVAPRAAAASGPPRRRLR